LTSNPLKEPIMTSDTATATTAAAEVAAVRGGFDAVAAGDTDRFAAMFHPDATWNHRNDDRLGGIKTGVQEILGFLGTSVQLTDGTLRPVPEIFMSDGAGHVAVRTRISGTRPDGRSFDDIQMLLFTLHDGRVQTVDQYVGDPTRVAAFWA
jgi:ketosteroid isomerase-like protein